MARKEKKQIKNFATENVLKKANRMMADQVELFNAYGHAVSKDGEGRYSGRKNPNELIKFDYEVRNKFLTRIYETRITVDLLGCELPESFLAECIFTGQIKAVAAYFKIRKGSKESAAFLNDEKLTDTLCEAAQTVPFGVITAEYFANESWLRIIIKTYAGSYVWIKFPPLSRAIPLHDDEIAKLVKLIRYLIKFFGKL